MPLPHFLLLIMAVILAAALTLWLAIALGVPEAALVLPLLGAAAALHLSAGRRRDHHG